MSPVPIPTIYQRPNQYTYRFVYWSSHFFPCSEILESGDPYVNMGHDSFVYYMTLRSQNKRRKDSTSTNILHCESKVLQGNMTVELSHTSHI